MKRILSAAVVLALLVGVSGCSTTERAAGFGAAAGGIIGGATTGTVRGAVVGATVGTVTGAIAGTLLGRSSSEPTKCVFEDRHGRRFVDECPRR
jgi:uncharacterized protein YcfJ